MQGHATAKASVHSARLAVYFAGHEAPPAEVRFDNLFVYEGQHCAAANMVACLDQRFRVAMDWETGDGIKGHALMRAFTSDSAYAAFFDASNVEVVLKVLDACALTERFWVFAAGLTHVDVAITVTDTGAIWSHHNELDEAFAPVQDTSALADCPH